MVEFTYNNSCHAPLRMSPFKVLYGQKCRTPINWNNPKDKLIFGPNILKEIEHTIRKVQMNLKAAPDEQNT